MTSAPEHPDDAAPSSREPRESSASRPESVPDAVPGTVEASPRSLNRQILDLALPAFGALIAEPLFLLADTAIVGHLGTAPLAGLSVGGNLVMTVIGLMIFLSYSTTPAVARSFGAGRMAEAYHTGVDGLWVGAGLGAVLAVLGLLFGGTALHGLGAHGEELVQAGIYLRWSMLGLPAMLMVFAALGVLRGLQDTRTPLLVAGAGAAVNVLVNWALVYGAHLGIAGSALGTSLVQWGMAGTYLWLIGRGVRKHDAGLRTTWHRARRVLSVGSWLMLRTLCMRVALLATVSVAAHQGATNLAAYQLTMSLFGFMAFGLDALAIAAQALLGKEMGARDLRDPQERTEVRRLMHRLVRWSVGFGVVTGLACPAIGFGLGGLFTPDRGVQWLFALAMLVVAVGQPLAAYVFVLDGVLIGAADVKYLARASFLSMAGYAPMLVVQLLTSEHSGAGMNASGFVWLWVAYAFGFMGLRGLTLGLRSRKDVWIRA